MDKHHHAELGEKPLRSCHATTDPAHRSLRARRSRWISCAPGIVGALLMFGGCGGDSSSSSGSPGSSGAAGSDRGSTGGETAAAGRPSTGGAGTSGSGTGGSATVAGRPSTGDAGASGSGGGGEAGQHDGGTGGHDGGTGGHDDGGTAGRDTEGASGAAGAGSGECTEGVTSITQYGITWSFGACAEAGQYANGDWWVVGPVAITRITPDAEVDRVEQGADICNGRSAGVQACEDACASSGTDYVARCGGEDRDGDCNCDHIRDGWEVNPMPGGGQGFDERAGAPDASLVPSLPYRAEPGQSIVKAVSAETVSDPPYGTLQTAAVLTVVAAAPTDGGATVFRPPYVGEDKPEYSTTDLRTELLPSLAPVEHTPTLDSVHEAFVRVQLDHETGGTGRFLHPLDNIPDYGADIAQRNDDAALRLMLDDPLEDKMPALIAYVQYGIDLYGMIVNGHTWPDGGGHRPGQKLPVTFASVLLGDTVMQDAIQAATFFHEDRGTFAGEGGVALYGFPEERGELGYWNLVVNDTGNRSRPDFYGYVDGGRRPGQSYQFCCTTQPWKGTVLAMRLMPELQDIWTNPVLFDYVDRWVTSGVWTQPDPCAPADGLCDGGDNEGAACNTANESTVCGGGGTCDLTVYFDPDGSLGLTNHYGVTYGPDGDGGCILDEDSSDGTGRFPALHETNVDDGYRKSAFQGAMWDEYL